MPANSRGSLIELQLLERDCVFWRMPDYACRRLVCYHDRRLATSNSVRSLVRQSFLFDVSDDPSKQSERTGKRSAAAAAAEKKSPGSSNQRHLARVGSAVRDSAIESVRISETNGFA